MTQTVEFSCLLVFSQLHCRRIKKKNNFLINYDLYNACFPIYTYTLVTMRYDSYNGKC